MNAQTRRLLVDGPVGPIEVAIDAPAGPPRGLALVAHPHPLFGGTLDNKVAQTLARAWLQLGFVAVRPNFRGVGGTAGSFDHGVGETDDLLAVLDHFTLQIAPQAGLEVHDLPLALAGFSFGAAVAACGAQALQQRGVALQHLTLVGTAVTRFDVPPIKPANAAPLAQRLLVLHGEQDDVVPLPAVLDWARPQQLPVVVFPGAGHFFHGLLLPLRDWVCHWHGAVS
ncbi:MAG: thioesterase domain-containing protein [Thiomonas sp.]|uniref:alpha/beta hydrolase n=1 Tax=Thiomonas sp. TaxID=2047785 RepID=UPI002A36CF12|nr:thioesterase domain-containing protein [Thiomonas sp.]MDY0329298.1 thioesterase domain-containing protein [Thiomonas sp.]